MPDAITDGATENVRIFIRNTSDRDIRLTVSDHAGYDYATATDPKDERMRTRPIQLAVAIRN